jgi:UDPglucose 6-dehydrogenase
MANYRKMNIGFIGLGKLGKDVAEVFSEKHYVEGYDINDVGETSFKVVSTIDELCRNKEIIFVAVPTPHHDDYDGSKITSNLEVKDFNYSIIDEVLLELSNYLYEDQVVVLISTVLPGTIRKEFKSWIKNFNLIYNPYLIAMGSVKYDVKNPEMVIIGTKDGKENEFTNKLKDLYDSIKDVDLRYELGTYEEAECIKIFYNTFISTKISLVNMIQDVAEKMGNIDTDIVTTALSKSDKRIVSSMYMKAGMGDGGSCHPRDNIALRFLSKKLDLGYDLFGTIMEARELQAKNIAKKLISLSDKHQLPIVIMGKSYKPDVEIYDGSYSILISNIIKNISNKTVIFDSMSLTGIYLLGHRGKYNDTEFPNGSIVLDPWRERIKQDTIYYGKKF